MAPAKKTVQEKKITVGVNPNKEFINNVDDAFMDFSHVLGAHMHNEMVDWSQELKIKWNYLYIKMQELKTGKPITEGITINTKGVYYFDK